MVMNGRFYLEQPVHNFFWGGADNASTSLFLLV